MSRSWLMSALDSVVKVVQAPCLTVLRRALVVMNELYSFLVQNDEFQTLMSLQIMMFKAACP